jgi:predicted DCC family thiol-disulfide oxidoreductase YuxK
MTQNTEVLYNGSCPVCSREINHYERLSQKQALAIQYDDLADSAKLKDWGLDADEAAKRLHVRKDGEIYSGVPAFIILWKDIPQMRWLAKIVSLPGVHKLACLTYDYVLAPLLFQWHLARQKRQNAA